MSKTPIDSFAFSDADGGITVVHVDDVFDDDHPYVKAYPSNFVEHEVNSIAAPAKRAKAPKVEQATAAPGDTRDVEPKARKFGTVTDQ
jgi:peptidoglycan hydrolase-like amidase